MSKIKSNTKLVGAVPRLGLAKLFATFSVAFLVFGAFTLISNASIFTENTSAVSVSDVSGTDTAPVSVSVSNSPLAYYISVSSSHGSSGSPVNLSYTMDGSGNQLGSVVSSSDLVTIDTNSPMSHQLLLSTTSDNTTTKANNLVGDNTEEDTEAGGLVPNTYISPSSSNSLNSATALSSNTWGFALDGSTPGIVPNNFNTEAEYTSTDQTIQNTNKYTSVPAKNSEVLVLEDTTATSTTTIYYGVLADRSLPAGNYSNTILYTALAEQPSEIRVVPTTLSRSVSSTPITIYTSISTADEDLGTATVLLKQNGTAKLACYNATPSLADNYLQVTCDAPILPEGTYTVELTLDKYGRILTGENILTYEGKTSLDTIETMQQMTSTICANAPEGATARLRDTRGRGNAGTASDPTYGIVKAKDGNCWMTENFDLHNKTISYKESDFSSGTYGLPASTNWDTNDITNPRIHVTTAAGLAGEVYYSWCAATGTSGSTATKCNSGAPINQSICPKNWRIPIYGDNTVDKSFTKLLDSYEVKTSKDLRNTLHQSYILGYYSFPGAYRWDAQGEYYQNIFAYEITNTTASNYYRAYQFLLDTGGNLLPQGFIDDKAHAISMRCVSR